LVQEGDIGWVSRKEILNNKQSYNFYITTDFATSSKQTADYVVISVWAYSKLGEWIWIDGIVERQTMTPTVNDLFRLVEEYQPQGVGVEISGQQQGFVDWLMMEMNNREKYFNLTHQNGKPGIRPATDKLSRFNMVVPLFKAGKVKFVEEMKTSRILGIFLEQISMVTKDGIKGKDDCVDTVSMLQYMNPWTPSGNAATTVISQGKEPIREVWGSMDANPNATDESSYSPYMA
jgi:predicted phage terminase large subunit-like protein